jgi:hypothetical protein
LFLSSNGLKHNHLYEDVQAAYDELKIICEEEDFVNTAVKLPSIQELNQHLQTNDDFEFYLPNSSWIHLQPFV